MQCTNINRLWTKVGKYLIGHWTEHFYIMTLNATLLPMPIHPNLSYHIVSYQSNPILSSPILSCPIIFYSILSYQLSYHFISSVFHFFRMILLYFCSCSHSYHPVKLLFFIFISLSAVILILPLVPILDPSYYLYDLVL